MPEKENDRKGGISPQKLKGKEFSLSKKSEDEMSLEESPDSNFNVKSKESFTSLTLPFTLFDKFLLSLGN